MAAFAAVFLLLFILPYQLHAGCRSQLPDSVTEAYPPGSATCRCYPAGTVNDSTCDETGQCQCLPGVDPDMACQYCHPYVRSVQPRFGPNDGGTIVTIQGNLFGENPEIKMKNYDNQEEITLNIIQQSEESIEVVVPDISVWQQIPADLYILMVLNGDFPLLQKQHNVIYTYKPNPIIMDIYPLKTIIKGGLPVTIKGENLLSVASPTMNMTYEDNWVSTRSCTGQDNATVICYYPEIRIFFRKKRSLNDGGFHRRRARQIQTDQVYRFQASFMFDGYIVDREVLVYQNPTIDWIGDVTFRTYSPYNDQILSITGQRLNQGAAFKDYEIRVGSGLCEIDLTKVFSNYLECRPPQEEPPPTDQYPVIENGKRRVNVIVGDYKVTVGSLIYEESFAENVAFMAGTIGGTVGLIVLIIIVVLTVRWFRSRQQQNVHFQPDETEQDMTPLAEQLSEELRLRLEDCLVDPIYLDRGAEIGKGNFGRVYMGVLDLPHTPTKEKVAVKTIRENTGSLKEVEEFLQEATMMKDFDHEHVLSLIGVIIEKNDVLVILPYMENGSLKDFLMNTNNTFRIVELVHMAHQAAKGMAYLENTRFIHRDLAARNCMVDLNQNIKIADFGLARDIYDKDYYKATDKSRPLPVKWTAIECLNGYEFTTKSDVWSFGVLVWEIMTRGGKPYQDVDAYNMRNYLSSGRRLPCPEYCPRLVYDLMFNCWLANPSERPMFSDIAAFLHDILDPYSKKTDPQENYGHHGDSDYVWVMPDDRSETTETYYATYAQGPDIYERVMDYPYLSQSHSNYAPLV